MPNYKANTLDGRSVQIQVEAGIISEINNIPNQQSLPLIAPPLFDTQNNGAAGYSFNQLSENIDQIYNMIAYYKAHGVGKVFATITTQPTEQLRKTGLALCKQMEKDQKIENFIPGIFHEGIYISKSDGWKGTHNLSYIKDPNYDEFKETNHYFENKIKLVNLAPEEPGGVSFIEKAKRDGLIVAIGHSNPSAEIIDQSIKAGATQVTHFGNGAASFVHRHHNPFWTMLARDELTLNLIGDSFHLPLDFISATMKAKGKDKTIMVSDCSGWSGKPAGEFKHHEHTIVLEENGYMHIKDQDILAGSWHQLDKSVETLCRIGWSLSDAWKQCSTRPAEHYGIELSNIQVGEKANFVISQYTKEKGLQLQTIYMDGEEITPLPVDPAILQNK